jgi:hypothetical protein
MNNDDLSAALSRDEYVQAWWMEALRDMGHSLAPPSSPA